MSEELPRKSRAMAWTVSIVMLAGLYLLSVPWEAVLSLKLGYVKGRVADSFYLPAYWAYEESPLRKSLDDYKRWCWHVAATEEEQEQLRVTDMLDQLMREVLGGLDRGR